MKRKTLGQLLKERRRSLALSQREMARRLGVKGSHIAYLESGARRPSFSLLRRIADLLDLNKQQLFLFAHPEAGDLTDGPRDAPRPRKGETLGQLVRSRRHALAASMRELARKAGISANYVAYLESGRRRPSIPVLRRVANALGLDKRQLFMLAYPEASDLAGRSDRRRAAKESRAPELKSSGGAPPVLRRFRPGFRWEGVKLEPYKPAAEHEGDFRGVSRQVLSGGLGERGAFHVRYLELEPGGFTSLERHRHCHFAIGVRGRGIVQVGKTRYQLGRFDAIYIGPDQPHQLAATGSGKFGFFCIVDARRDRPRPVT